MKATSLECWRAGVYHLNSSISAPLNPTGKPLFLLARDLEAEPPPGATETASIGRKTNHHSGLASLIVIIQVTAQ
jgi:hypothetical protein